MKSSNTTDHLTLTFSIFWNKTYKNLKTVYLENRGTSFSIFLNHFSSLLISKSESVKFLLIESVIWLFTDSSVKKYISLLNQLIFTDSTVNKYFSKSVNFHWSNQWNLTDSCNIFQYWKHTYSTICCYYSEWPNYYTHIIFSPKNKIKDAKIMYKTIRPQDELFLLIFQEDIVKKCKNFQLFSNYE